MHHLNIIVCQTLTSVPQSCFGWWSKWFWSKSFRERNCVYITLESHQVVNRIWLSSDALPTYAIKAATRLMFKRRRTYLRVFSHTVLILVCFVSAADSSRQVGSERPGWSIQQSFIGSHTFYLNHSHAGSCASWLVSVPGFFVSFYWPALATLWYFPVFYYCCIS